MIAKKKGFLAKSWVRKASGCLLITVGVIGLFLPVIQGTLLIIAGLLILKPRFLAARMEKFKQQLEKRKSG